MFIVVSVYFFINSVRKLSDTPSYTWPHAVCRDWISTGSGLVIISAIPL